MFHLFSKQILLCTLLTLLLVVMPTYAVEVYKVSQNGGGVQIWFEVEAYDERNPDTEDHYPVIDKDDAFGQAITRTGATGGYVKYIFDISEAGGAAGTWYFWARLINPNNTSDYLVVAGQDDQKIADALAMNPFPGRPGPFLDGEDRIFEQSQGPPWTWGIQPPAQGHVQELQDGVNTMYIFGRQGDPNIFWDTFMWTDTMDYMPVGGINFDDDYNNATEGGGEDKAVKPADKLATVWGEVKSSR